MNTPKPPPHQTPNHALAASDEASPLQFPCDFPLKVMGENSDDFVTAIHAIVCEHAPDYDHTTTASNTSRTGKYVSLTLTINAHSREQLDAIYRAVTAHPLSRYVL